LEKLYLIALKRKTNTTGGLPLKLIRERGIKEIYFLSFGRWVL